MKITAPPLVELLTLGLLGDGDEALWGARRPLNLNNKYLFVLMLLPVTDDRYPLALMENLPILLENLPVTIAENLAMKCDADRMDGKARMGSGQ